VQLLKTYKKVNSNFKWDEAWNPKRILTTPSEGVLNDGYDNEESEYILKVNDTL